MDASLHSIPEQFTVPTRYLDYNNWESVPCRLSGTMLGGNLQKNQRAYFNSNDISNKGKRLTSIQIMPGVIQEGVSSTTIYQGLTVISYNQLKYYTLTLVNMDGIETHKDIPVMELTPNTNFGKLRIFDVFADLAKSYVTNTVGNVSSANRCILFNFHTVNW